MNDPVDLSIARRLAELELVGEPDWLDVRRRARRRPVRRLVLAAAATAALLAVAPALGLHHDIVDFFAAEPAPEQVRLDFARLDIGAPQGMAPRVIPMQTRKVPVPTVDRRGTYVWVAPTELGGFCFVWENQVGGCRRREGGGVGASYSATRTDAGQLVGEIHGATTLSDAKRLELRLADGTALDLPLTWVSAPIDAGFYAYEAPPERGDVERRPAELVLYAEGDDVLARESFPVPDPLTVEDPATGLPRAVVYEQRREVLSIQTEQGRRITLFSAPSRHRAPAWDGRCMWLSERGGPVDRAFYGCGNPFPGMPAIGAGIQGGATVLFAGAVGARVASIELRFQDGDMIEIPAAEGYVLAEIPSLHQSPGHRLELAIARDVAGAEVGRKTFDPTSRGIYPCAREDEIELGLGVTTCP